MNTEERDLITRFIQRVGGTPAPSVPAGGSFGSVPSTAVAAAKLPPVDTEADALIAEQFARFPEARYRVTQMAFVQEFALVEAQNRIERLQWELTQAKSANQAPPGTSGSPWGQSAQPQQQSRGLFGSLFGGSQQPQQPQYQQPQPQYAQPPQPQYAPGYQPGMFQQRGSGFLGSALTTAAGVAGGMVAGHALMNMFSGSHGDGHASSVSDPTAGNVASPWTPAPADQGGAWTPVEQAGAGGWSNPTSDTSQGQDGGWSTPSADSGWSDVADNGSDSGWSDPDQG